MSEHYRSVAFTPGVLAAQEGYGSRTAAGRGGAHDAHAEDARDPMGPDERAYIAEMDSFYVATVSETGWPYVQFRGGPPGFVSTPDEHTIVWPDFRGNRQYISTGNLGQDDRLALIFLDQARQVRLKVYGRAQVIDTRREPTPAGREALAGYRATVEREVRVSVTAFDWNCPQHITPRFSES